MTSKFLGKTDIVRAPDCSFCALPCEHEQFEFTHQFRSGKKVTKTYCSVECLREEMGINDHIIQEVERRTRQEFNWLHKQICPRCRTRIIKSV